MHHEWLYREKGIIKPSRKFTFELKEHKTELPLAEIKLEKPSDEGYAHGFVFGDGNYQNENYCMVPLFDNDIDLKPLLLRFGNLSYKKRGHGWTQYQDVIASLPRHWKELPINPTKTYAFGFILGLVAADGCSDGQLRIYQANTHNLEEIHRLAIFAGLRVSPIYLSRELSPFDNSYKPLYYFSINTYNIKPEWIIRKDHRKKMVVRRKKTSTTVTNIDWTSGKEEEVYCAYVPKYHNFTLANGVITGNCLGLPDKIFRTIVCKPSRSILNAAKIITAKSDTTIKSLILLRELSDGFQYENIETGSKTCELCKGTKTTLQWTYIGPDELLEDVEGNSREDQELFKRGHNFNQPVIFTEHPDLYGERDCACSACDGLGEVIAFTKQAIQVPCPKEDVLIDLLEEYEDVGRVVIYAGFTGSVNRCIDIVTRRKWDWIKVDGRGWSSSIAGLNNEDLIKLFQNPTEKNPRIAFIGQPSAGGLGLTLTASPVIIYYSNDFNGESRAQSMERIHRIGMDTNRGATIIDLIHLPTDKLVIDNLNKKIKLQNLTMGVVQSSLEEGVEER